MESIKREWKVSDIMSFRSMGDDCKAYFILGEIGGNSDRTIAEVGCWKDREHPLEDAHLIAAAPRMYEALKLIWNDLCENGRITEPIENVLKQVLAKADGK